MWIATAAQSREIDRRATEEFGIPARVLMERAGMAVFEVVRELLPEGGRITVLCGRGNNGGDGFVVARLAYDLDYHVECLVAAEEHELSPDAAEQMRIARAQGVTPVFFSDARWRRKAEHLCCRDLVVDALLGTGAHSEVRGPIKEAIQAINKSGVPAIAVDVPSGIHCDTGEELGESVWALRTVTFGLAKPFLFEGMGVEHSGYWSVAEIGFPHSLLAEPTEARLIERDWVANLLPERLKSSHKGDTGSVLIVAGSHRMRGAAVLAATAAIRSGCGLVTVASVPAVIDAVSYQLPEALLLPLPEKDGAISPEAADIVLSQSHKTNAAVFGPGLSTEEPVWEFLDRVWTRWEHRSVVDADAITLVSKGLRLPAPDCVLTPHPGEMSRLLSSSSAEVQADRFRAVRQAVAGTGKCVLLKGAYSIVGEPCQPMVVNTTGNSGMATGGMGDVLSGVIGALLAQQLPDWIAASCGMYWHGLAANLCAEEIGPFGYMASEVAKMLPKARARMVPTCDTK